MTYLKNKISSILLVGINVNEFESLIPRILKRQKGTDILTDVNIKTIINRKYDSDELNVKKCLEQCDLVLNNSGSIDQFKREIYNVLF